MKALSCPECGTKRPIGEFRIGILNEEATFTCPVCDTRFGIKMVKKTSGAGPVKSSDGTKPELGGPSSGGPGAPPPPGPSLSTSPEGGPMESVDMCVMGCAECGSEWIALREQKACPNCHGDVVSVVEKSVKERINDAVRQVSHGVKMPTALGLLFGNGR